MLEARIGWYPIADQLIGHAKDKLGGVKSPKSVDFTDALARSPVAKVLKKTLCEPCWAGRERKI